jgi:hypothetical protein
MNPSAPETTLQPQLGKIDFFGHACTPCTASGTGPRWFKCCLSLIPLKFGSKLCTAKWLCVLGCEVYYSIKACTRCV